MLQNKQLGWISPKNTGKTLNSSALLNAAARGDGDDGEAAEVARHDVGLSEQCQGPDAE